MSEAELSAFDLVEKRLRDRYTKAVISQDGRWRLYVQHNGCGVTVTWQDAGYGVFTVSYDDVKHVDRVLHPEVAYCLACEALGEP